MPCTQVVLSLFFFLSYLFPQIKRSMEHQFKVRNVTVHGPISTEKRIMDCSYFDTRILRDKLCL
jgi:hypothetical protein